jgi:hypothetical protein
MPIAALENLVRSGVLEAHAPNESEIENLVGGALAQLSDAENTALSIESRFSLGYSAAHALSLAALRLHGYRPRNKRYIVFEALAHTLDLPAKEWRILARAHQHRNLIEYEGGVRAGERLVEALLRITRDIAERVQARRAASE